MYKMYQVPSFYLLTFEENNGLNKHVTAAVLSSSYYLLPRDNWDKHKVLIERWQMVLSYRSLAEEKQQEGKEERF